MADAIQQLLLLKLHQENQSLTIIPRQVPNLCKSTSFHQNNFKYMKQYF